ncbi:hypothetical protein J6590_106196 [Homalodisca vitripennis]|nr:hypothetical protein J6590_106196 [Homalodisca vitripennis]
MYFMTYEWIQELLKPDGATEVSTLSTVFAGGMAGVFNWLIGMPADVLKSRLQTGPRRETGLGCAVDKYRYAHAWPARLINADSQFCLLHE